MTSQRAALTPNDPPMTPLPIDELLPKCLEKLASGSLVVVAPPGSGKTTRLPAAIVESGRLPASHPNLVVLQPRRIAARASRPRVAEERGWTLGDRVGYQVRFDRRYSDATRLRFITEGVLTRQILADPFLETVGARRAGRVPRAEPGIGPGASHCCEKSAMRSGPTCC